MKKNGTTNKDFLTPVERRIRMQVVKSKNSRSELLVFRYLRREGVYFQKHYKSRFGNLDIALPRKKRAVLIDGDFWHGRTIDRVMERGADDYWTKKIQRNIERDADQGVKLHDAGWRIHRVWESDLKRKRTQKEVLEKIRAFLIS